MKRTLFSLLAVLMVLSLLVAACGPTAEPTTVPEPTEAAPEPTSEGTAPEPTAEEPKAPALTGTINLWHSWKENEIESLNEVVAAFQAKYPDVQFEVLQQAFPERGGRRTFSGQKALR